MKKLNNFVCENDDLIAKFNESNKLVEKYKKFTKHSLEKLKEFEFLNMDFVDVSWLLDHPSQWCSRAFLNVSVRDCGMKVCRTSGVWLESELILRKLPRVSEVVTNHWVFLRGDWSSNSSRFYYRS